MIAMFNNQLLKKEPSSLVSQRGPARPIAGTSPDITNQGLPRELGAGLGRLTSSCRKSQTHRRSPFEN